MVKVVNKEKLHIQEENDISANKSIEINGQLEKYSLFREDDNHDKNLNRKMNI
jgi:hypothetical protein